MTRRLRIAIGSAIILVGLLAIVVLSFLGVTHTSVGQERVRSMVATMLEGKVKGKAYIGHMSGGLVGGVRIDSEARVLGEAAAPVDGLYAAGADAGGISTGGYASGLASALVFGRIAAETAASS